MESNNLIEFFNRTGIPVKEIGTGRIQSCDTDIEIAFGMFDGCAFGIYRWVNDVRHYAKLVYPTLQTVIEMPGSTQEIIRHCYAGRTPEGFEATIIDIALTFGELKWMTLRDFEFEVETALMKEGKPPKHFRLFSDEGDFLDELDGKVYGIADTDGQWLCELHEKEYISLCDRGSIIDTNENLEIKCPESNVSDIFLADESKRAEVFGSRIEIVILSSNDK